MGDLTMSLKMEYRTFLEKLRTRDIMGARMTVARVGETLRTPEARAMAWHKTTVGRWKMLHEVLQCFEREGKGRIG